MFTGSFSYNTTLHANLDEVWTLFSSAENLVRVTRFPKISLHSDPSTVKGNHLELELNFVLFRLNWRLIILDVQAKSFFIDEALRIPFPFRAWRHTHSFAQVGESTVMTDKVEFEAYVPALLVRLLLRGMFMDRERAIKNLLSPIKKQ